MADAINPIPKTELIGVWWDSCLEPDLKVVEQYQEIVVHRF
jgi:hypothetical protein